MEIPEAYPLRADCILTPDSNVLGGQVSLIIKNLGEEGQLLQDGDTAPIQLQPGLGELLDGLADQVRSELSRTQPDSLVSHLLGAARNLRQITDRVNAQVALDGRNQSLLSKLHLVMERLDGITENISLQLSSEANSGPVAKLNLALDTLNKALGQIENLVEPNKDDLTATVQSLKQAANQLETDLPEFFAAATRPLRRADAVMEDAREVLDYLKDATRTARQVLLVNRERIESMVNNLDELSVNLKLASREIRRAPWRLLHKPQASELNRQNIVDAAGSFAAAAERLDATMLRLQALAAAAIDEQPLPVDKDRIDQIIAELETSFNQFQKAEKVFWNELE